jgi:putative N6-adenine-specific DNA methylase
VKQRVFITCVPGLEQVLADEVVALGYEPVMGKGCVTVHVTSLRDAMFFNLHLRTASRVLWHLFDIKNPTKQRIYEAVFRANWTSFFKNLPTFSIDVPFAAHPDFTNTLYVAQLVKDAICDNLRDACGERPSVDTKDPGILLSVVVDQDKAQVSFDTSGQPLFKRGYRPEGGEAPLKETLAAALLMLAGYKEECFLFDPCCGTGTFLIEAALMATHTAPGLLRDKYGFFLHPQFDFDEWDGLRKEASRMVLPMKGLISGCEKDAKTYRLLHRAIAKSGFMGAIDTQCTDFQRAVLSKAPTFVITNPPFGIRLSDDPRLMRLYEDLGQLLKQKTHKPATGAVLLSSPIYAKAIGLRSSKKIPVSHGGLECFLYVYDLYDGKKTEITP